MIIGIVGLGLIGGSFAKAYHGAGETVLAWNRSRSTLEEAMACGAVDGELTEENLSRCDLILVALYPDAAVAYLERMGRYIGPHPIVIDACGTKREVCSRCFPLAEHLGFTYVGGHPMAGIQYSGFAYAREDMYRGAPMVLVPPEGCDPTLIDRAKALLAPAGFGMYSVTTALAHDEMIAFTSQMPHILSNAFIKSPTARKHKGFSAGSYKDLTRVAWLNPEMWAELFLENKDCVLKELSLYLENLRQYEQAIAAEDREGLIALLEEGKRCKEEVDGDGSK